MNSEEKNWKSKLSPEQYHILRDKGTEAAFSGKLLYNKKEGIYVCAACGNSLFRSETKFDSGCGWPSFFKPLEAEHIEEKEDTSLGMRRIEVTCSRCGSHLGHVFDDGPNPTGLRYCINSLSLDFQEEKKPKTSSSV